VNVLCGFTDISLLQLVLVAGVALFASIVGGLAGYGTGALMPLVLVTFAPPACSRSWVIRANSLAIKPSSVAISKFGSGLATAERPYCSPKGPFLLRTSGLYPFGTVREIRSFRVTYGPRWKVVRSFLSHGREPPICKLIRSQPVSTSPLLAVTLTERPFAARRKVLQSSPPAFGRPPWMKLFRFCFSR
jgi:hypothetical protein